MPHMVGPVLEGLMSFKEKQHLIKLGRVHEFKTK